MKAEPVNAYNPTTRERFVFCTMWTGRRVHIARIDSDGLTLCNHEYASGGAFSTPDKRKICKRCLRLLTDEGGELRPHIISIRGRR